MAKSPEEMAQSMIDNLEASGSFNAMVSHRVRLESPEEVDDEVVGWLRRAYDEA